MSRYPTAEVAPLSLGVPVVGIVCSSYFLDERLSQLQIIGILMVMTGLIINVLGGKFLVRKPLKKH